MTRYIKGIDLDGTLLTTDKKITNRTLAVIKQAVERGNIIVPITGRPLSCNLLTIEKSLV